MAVTKRLRYEVLKRDNYACHYCGGAAPDVVLTVDHVVPVALGGTDLANNLVTACKDCNAGKSSVPADAPLVAEVNRSAERWALAIRCVAQTFDDEIAELDLHRSAFYSDWKGYKNGYGETMPLDGNWPGSIDRFRSLGMTDLMLAECVRIAMAKPGVRNDDVFRYFCGIAWAKVREMQDVAMQMADKLEREAADGA